MTGPGSVTREDGLFARVLRNERLWIASIGVILGLILFQALTFYSMPLATGKQDSTDFMAFYVAGRMVWDHIPPRPTTPRCSSGISGPTDSSTPPCRGPIRRRTSWSWRRFGLAPVWLGYLVYTLPGFALFAHVVKKLGGPYAPGALAVVLPAAIINARSGQTGFWVAGAIGLFVLWFRDSKDRAGLPLGLMILKPHLAAGIGVLTLISGKWRIVAIAAATIAANFLLATLAFGPGIWTAFRAGVSSSSGLLWEGNFPMARMVTVFAFVYRSGVSPAGAMAIHAAIALAGVAGLVWLWRRRARPDVLLATAVAVGLVASPYSYDYDLTALALPAALLLPDLARHARGVGAGRHDGPRLDRRGQFTVDARADAGDCPCHSARGQGGADFAFGAGFTGVRMGGADSVRPVRESA